MARRKTVDVQQLINTTNQILRTSTCDAHLRKGWCAALEWVLHETGNYRGYRYLTADEVPQGQAPGIRMSALGEIMPCPERFVACDDTRRQYS